MQISFIFNKFFFCSPPENKKFVLKLHFNLLPGYSRYSDSNFKFSFPSTILALNQIGKINPEWYFCRKLNMRIDILTVVPELLESPFNHSILKRAKEKGLVDSYEDDTTEEMFFLTKKGKRVMKKKDGLI